MKSVVFTGDGGRLTFEVSDYERPVASDEYDANWLTTRKGQVSSPRLSWPAAMLRFDARLQVRKGNVRIVVNVRDAATGKMGTARRSLRVE